MRFSDDYKKIKDIYFNVKKLQASKNFWNKTSYCSYLNSLIIPFQKTHLSYFEYLNYLH